MKGTRAGSGGHVTPPGLAKGSYGGQAPPSQRQGDGPPLQAWPGTVSSFGSLELSQAGTLRGLGSSQGCGLEALGTLLAFVPVLVGQVEA